MRMNIVVSEPEVIILFLFNLNFYNLNDVFHRSNIIPTYLFNNIENKGHKGQDEPKEEPDVQELDISRVREGDGDGLEEGVHDQHGGDLDHDIVIKVINTDEH
jgi:hypothetical protein